MALNLLGSNFGNQNYTPAQSGGWTDLFERRYNKPISTSRTIYGKPITKSYTKRITLPEKKRMTYAEANIPDPVGFETARVPLKSVFTSKRSERREYVSSVKKYNEEATAFNTEIEKAKKQVDVYNKEVDEWNTKGRFQEITTTYTETPTYKSTITFDVPKEESKTNLFTTNQISNTKNLTSKERLDAISKPKDYFKSLVSKKEKLDFIKTQETKVSDFGKNLSGGIKFAYKTFKERGITGLDAEVKKQESIFYPKAKDRIKEGYNYVTGGSGFFKYTNPLFYVSKVTEGISRTGTNLVKDFPSTSEKAYQGSLQLRGATIQSAKFITAYDPRDTLRGVKSKFSNQPNLRESILSAYNTVYTPADRLSKINYKEDLKDFYKGTKKVGNVILTSEYKPEMETKKIGGFTFTVRKEPTAFEKRYQTAKSIELLTNPKTYYFTTGVLAESAVFNLPKVVKPFKDEWLKFGATYVDPKDVFSKQSFKNDKLTNALVRTKSVPDAFGSLSKTKGIYPEYPEHYVLQSSLQDNLPKTFGVLSQKQKIARGLKVRYEDDVMWYGTKGEGAVWALRISPNDKYALGLLPNWAKSNQPAILETLVKRGQRLPEDVLFKKGFELQGEYQRFKTLTKPSLALFPKRSETSKIGYDLIRKKIKSIDPALRGSSELQFGTFPGTLNVPAKKLLKTWLGRFKGFEEYTMAYGQVIPIRKGIISGASIYTPGPRADLYRKFLKSKPLAIGQKGAVDIFGSKKISKSFKDYLYDYGLASHQRSISQNYGKNAISLAYSNANRQSLVKIPVLSFFRGSSSSKDSSISKDLKYNRNLTDYFSRYKNRDISNVFYRQKELQKIGVQDNSTKQINKLMKVKLSKIYDISSSPNSKVSNGSLLYKEYSEYLKSSGQSFKKPVLSFFRGSNSSKDSSISKDLKYNRNLMDYFSRYKNRDISSDMYRPTKQLYTDLPTDYDFRYKPITTETRSDYEYDTERRVNKYVYKSPPPIYYPDNPYRLNLGYKYDNEKNSYSMKPKKTKVSKTKSLTEQAFVPAVKMGSRYKEIKSNKKMNYYYAMHKGAKIVDNTTARNFKLKPVSGKPTLFKMNAPNNISKFYKPSKTQKEYFRGAYIEKSRHAIDTLGERQGLSVARYLKKMKL